jgi:hypothetical protein
MGAVGVIPGSLLQGGHKILAMRVGIVAIASLCTLAAQVVAPNVGHYNAATCTSSGLTIFPADGKEFSIPLPITLRYVTFGASGESLYASGFKRLDAKTFTDMPGLFKIELNPVRVTTLPGSDTFYLSGRFAVSRREDMILFAGVRTDATSKACGVFELNIADGKLLPVLESTDCKAGSPWRVLDFAPNGAEALISANRQVSVLDLGSSKITPLGNSVWRASYSPDGKWIAALELGGPKIPSKTVLIDRKDFFQRRDLGGLNDDELVWSPDSRLLLHADYRPACPSQNPIALETMDVETGKRTVLKNSVCKAGASRDMGWVSAKVGK